MNTELISLKGRLPFRVSTTSYIIPDNIVQNVLFLSGYVDEVELVFFETFEKSNFPDQKEIDELRHISEENNITYSVHLPAEVFLGDPDPKSRRKDCDKVLRFYDRALLLEPDSFILHLDRRASSREVINDTRALLENLWDSIEYLKRQGMELKRVAVENLDYSLSLVQSIVAAARMSYCVDLGHLIFYGLDLEQEINKFLHKSIAVHLHGTVDSMDHRSLDGIGEREWMIIESALASYQGSVSIEVFSIKDLALSLRKIKNSPVLGNPK